MFDWFGKDSAVIPMGVFLTVRLPGGLGAHLHLCVCVCVRMTQQHQTHLAGAAVRDSRIGALVVAAEEPCQPAVRNALARYRTGHHDRCHDDVVGRSGTPESTRNHSEIPGSLMPQSGRALRVSIH